MSGAAERAQDRRLVRLAATCATFGLAAVACTGTAAPPSTLEELRFTPELDAGEQYLCWGFDAAPLADRYIHAIELDAPDEGGVSLHHVALYVVAGAYPAGPLACEMMPEGAVELDVWAPGGAPLELPDDVGLVVPPESTLVVQAHALRTRQGPAAPATLRLRLATATPPHLAGWLRAPAPVPAIRPHHDEVSTAVCRPEGALHLLSTWPHMHRIGAEFLGTVLRAGGARETLVEVTPWRFDEQRAYPLDVELAEGDAIETRCAWRNDGDEYVLPGPRTVDEMCGQSLVAWPLEAARCAP